MKWTVQTIGMAVFAVFMVVGGPTANGALNVSRNGLVWPTTFEGDTLPQSSTPAWSVFDDNGIAATASDGDVYSITSGSVGATSSFQVGGATWNAGSNARTVEFRARIPNASAQAADGAASLVIGINNIAYDLRLYADGLAYNGSGGLTAPANRIPLDLTQFQTIRIVVDQSSSPSFSLYLNQAAAPIFTSNDSWFVSPGFDKLVFGDISTGGISGTSEWDYISWSAAGAYAPTATGQRSWASDGSGDWYSSQNWVEGDVPDEPNSIAVFGDVLTRPRTVYMNAPTTVGGVRFTSPFGYAVAGQGMLQLTGSGGASVIEVEGGANASAHQFLLPVQFGDDANVTVGDGARLTFNHALQFDDVILIKTGEGTLRINSRLGNGIGELQINAGTVDGGGKIAASVNLGSGAMLAPGDGIGTMTVAGNFIQSSGSDLNIEIGGEHAGGYDILEVLGGLTLSGGTLNVALRNGFAPSPGDTFSILQFASVSGSFAGINLPPNIAWDTSRLLSEGILAVSAFRSGDYNQDGIVDAADYTVWRDALGSTQLLAADGNANGVVDSGDYDVWKSSFAAGSGASIATVPEPSGAMLTVMSAIAIVIGCRTSSGGSKRL